MQNYNIKDYITRTDAIQMQKKLLLQLRKEKNRPRPLSLCLIKSGNSVLHNSHSAFLTLNIFKSSSFSCNTHVFIFNHC